MSKQLKVALLQLVSSGRDRDANLQKGGKFCQLAAMAGADLALPGQASRHVDKCGGRDAALDERRAGPHRC